MQASQPSQADQGEGGRGAAGHEDASSKETVSAEAGPAAMQVDQKAVLKEPVGTMPPSSCYATSVLSCRAAFLPAWFSPGEASHHRPCLADLEPCGLLP